MTDYKDLISPSSLAATNFANLQKAMRNYHYADWMCEKLIEKINIFEQHLPQNQQAGGRLINFGNTTFSIEDVGYQNPDMLIFYGQLPDGSKVELLQHTSQLNLLLVAVKRGNPNEPRRKIGFDSKQD